jgi:heme/copper-type cytochrome/quinol oxidase subunit 2
MGLKVDAVPGRLNQFVTLINRPGVFYGQCSELCGVAHGFMPIVVQALPYDTFMKTFSISNKALNPTPFMDEFMQSLLQRLEKHRLINKALDPIPLDPFMVEFMQQ